MDWAGPLIRKVVIDAVPCKSGVYELYKDNDCVVVKYAPVAGSIPAGRSKSLSSLVEGGFLKPASQLEKPFEDDEPEVVVPTRICQNPDCGKPLAEKKGKWVCMDPGCGLYGQEQKGKR